MSLKENIELAKTLRVRYNFYCFFETKIKFIHEDFDNVPDYLKTKLKVSSLKGKRGYTPDNNCTEI